MNWKIKQIVLAVLLLGMVGLSAGCAGKEAPNEAADKAAGKISEAISGEVIAGEVAGTISDEILALLPEGAENVEVFQAAGFLALQYVAEGEKKLDFYDLDGQPLLLAHQYIDLSQFDIYDLREADRPQLYKACYLDAQGREIYDVLDGEAGLWQFNLLAVKYLGGGTFEATQGWGDQNVGLLNLQGEWTFVKSIFDGKVD